MQRTARLQSFLSSNSLFCQAACTKVARKAASSNHFQPLKGEGYERVSIHKTPDTVNHKIAAYWSDSDVVRLLICLIDRPPAQRDDCFMGRSHPSQANRALDISTVDYSKAVPLPTLARKLSELE